MNEIASKRDNSCFLLLSNLPPPFPQFNLAQKIALLPIKTHLIGVYAMERRFFIPESINVFKYLDSEQITPHGANITSILQEVK